MLLGKCTFGAFSVYLFLFIHTWLVLYAYLNKLIKTVVDNNLFSDNIKNMKHQQHFAVAKQTIFLLTTENGFRKSIEKAEMN